MSNSRLKRPSGGEAVGQVTDYLKLVRTEQGNDKTLYAIVTIGHYSRLYLLNPNDSEMSDFPGTNGKYYEFKNDEADIERLLNALIALTS